MPGDRCATTRHTRVLSIITEINTFTVRGDVLSLGKPNSRHPYSLQENCPSVRCDDATMPCWGANVDCVAKPDNSWAQCIDCTPSTFQQDCVKWDTQLRSAAVQDCQVNCLNTMCTVDASGMQCVNDYTCVSQSDGAWSQCIGKVPRGEVNLFLKRGVLRRTPERSSLLTNFTLHPGRLLR